MSKYNSTNLIFLYLDVSAEHTKLVMFYEFTKGTNAAKAVQYIHGVLGIRSLNERNTGVVLKGLEKEISPPKFRHELIVFFFLV